MGNETCPPDPIGAGSQQDLNGPTESPVQVGFVQRHNLQTLQTLCQAGLSPALTVGVVMEILRLHFSSPVTIMEPTLKQYLWSTDPATSKLRIVPNTLFDPVNAGQLPALVIKRAPFTSSRRSMGDRLESIDPNDAAIGLQGYVRFHQGSIKVFCVSETSGEAESLALEVFDTMTFLSPMLVERLPFHDFQVTGLGEQGVLEGMGNRIGIPVVMEFTYEYAWAVKPLAPRLKTLDIQTDH